MAKLEGLKLGKTVRKPFSFIRKTKDGDTKVEVLIEVLTARELDLARIDAANYIKSLASESLDSSAAHELSRDAEEIEVLARALKDPEHPEELWAGPSMLRTRLTSPEIALLAKAVEEHQQDVGPILHKLSAKAFDDLVQNIAENESADPLVFFDAHTQKNFIVIMASRLWSLQTDKLSTSLRSNETDNESSENLNENNSHLDDDLSP